jgi:hypothetical protein
LKKIEGHQIKSKKIKRKSKEGSPDPQDLREREFDCSSQPWAILAMRRGYAAPVSRRLLKGIQRKSKEIKRN